MTRPFLADVPGVVRRGRAYADPAYAASLAEHGRPLLLPASGASVLVVPVGASGHVEAVGPYPLLSCPRPDGLVEDLAVVAASGAVTLTAVLDPMRPLPSGLEAHADVLRPFKRHFVTLLEDDAPDVPSSHHRRALRRARAHVEVVVDAGADADVAAWWALWEGRARELGLTGMRAPARDAFARSFALDGAVVLWAWSGGALMAAQVVLLSDQVAHAHLAVVTPAGRAVGAGYALDAATLELARGRVRAVHWGGAAGDVDVDDGLATYKRGWSNDVRTAHLLGVVLDREAFHALAAATAPRRGAGGAASTATPTASDAAVAAPFPPWRTAAVPGSPA